MEIREGKDGVLRTDLEGLKAIQKPIALFLTYQRTTFTDAYRTVLRLKEHGAYEPVFLIAAGTAHLLEREVELCLQHSIAIFTEEEVLLAAEPPKPIQPLVVVADPPEVPPEAAVVADIPAAVPTLEEIVPTAIDRLRDTSVRVKTAIRRRWIWATNGLRGNPRPILDADKTDVYFNDAVIVTWNASNPRAAACEIFLTDEIRTDYLVWNGLSGSAMFQVTSDSTLTLRCTDSEGTALPVAAPLQINLKKERPRQSALSKLVRPADAVIEPQIESDDEELESEPRGLAHRRVLRREPWFWWFQQILKADLRYEKILREINPAIVCLSEDILGPLSGPLIRAARRRGIPSVIVPFTIPNPIEILEYCIKNPESVVQSPKHDELLAAFPHFFTSYKDRLLLRSNPELLLASELSGIGSKTPFISNSGHADRILVESERMLAVYQKLGFPAEQLTLAGSVTDDRLFGGLQRRNELRNALYARLGLPSDRPMLLSALVPDQLVSGVPWCEFTTYPELVEFWVKTIAGCSYNYNVVLKINPRAHREDYLHLERYGVRIAPDDTVDLVPLADIYITSLSSTLRWAAACGIPCVNYDVYHFRYGDYAGTPGIVHVEKMDEFVSTVNRLANDDAFRADLRTSQAADAPSWGKLDGLSLERIVNCFDTLCAQISGVSRRSRKRDRASQ